MEEHDSPYQSQNDMVTVVKKRVMIVMFCFIFVTETVRAEY